ncbi:MAG: hypothetical protein KJ941_07135 [Bacteroidetes bacterium]|nr:hypothetical protein [Bacteroidota bacterium]
MISSLFQSIKYHVKGISWIVLQLSKGKFLLFFLPGIVLSFFFWNMSGWSDTMENRTFYENVPLIGSYINTTVQSGFHLLGFLFKQFQIFFLLTILSPLFTWLSEKVDEELTGTKASFDLIQIITELLRMIGIVMVSLILEGVLIGLYSIVSGVFPLEFLDSPVAFSIAAFFYGFSFYDYSLERYQIGIFMSVSFARQKAMLNFVTGICFSCLTLIPVVGLAIGPVIATMMATYVFLADVDKIKKGAK